MASTNETILYFVAVALVFFFSNVMVFEFLLPVIIPKTKCF